MADAAKKNEIIVEEGSLGIKMMLSDDGKQVFIVGLYKGNTGKSKKGNLNMSWHTVKLFMDAVKEFIKKNGLDEEVPF